MSKQKSKAEIQAHKDQVLNHFSAYLDSLIQSADTNDSKRVDLISYWLKDFQQYLSHEKNFDAAKIKSYKRGDVIKVNLGFNVGSEQGGLHYAIVLDKDNKHNAKTVTIIPLTSQKSEKPIYERDIPLGTELYSRLKSKYDSAKNELKNQLKKCLEDLSAAENIRNTLAHFSDADKKGNDSFDKTMTDLDKRITGIQLTLTELEEKGRNLRKINQELLKMKNGSIAKIEQITTISKQRIYDPKKSADVLSGIRFSDTAMEKINEKIKELYIF